jgi:predicted amino acid dehydrogenase
MTTDNNLPAILAALGIGKETRAQFQPDAMLSALQSSVALSKKLVEALTHAEKVVIEAGGLGSYDVHVKNGGFEANVNNCVFSATQCLPIIEQALELAKQHGVE